MKKKNIGENMKKKISIAFVVSALFVGGVHADNIEDMQQETSIILMQKVKILENKVRNLENKQIRTENRLKNLEKNMDIRPSFFSGDVDSLTSDSKKKLPQSSLRGMSKKNSTQSNMHTAELLDKFYQITRECKTYWSRKSSNPTSKVFAKSSFVKIVSRGTERSKTSTGLWIDNDCLDKAKKIKDNLKGVFYSVRTYMANTRTKPGVENPIMSVLLKNDILLVQGEKVKSKDGGVWLKTKSNGYMNARIAQPYIDKEKRKNR